MSDDLDWFDDKPAPSAENKKYTIYHIVGRKCGCTDNLKRRTKQYRNEGELRELEVVEIVLGTAKQAAEQEDHWNDHHGYPRGPRYDISRWDLNVSKETMRKNGKRAVELGQWARIAKLGGKIGGKIANAKLTFEQRSKGGKAAGKKNVESGRWARIRTKKNARRAAKSAVRSSGRS